MKIMVDREIERQRHTHAPLVERTSARAAMRVATGYTGPMAARATREQRHLSTLRFQPDGVERLPSLLSAEEISAVKADINLESPTLQTHGVRNLKKRFLSIATLAMNEQVLGIAERELHGTARLVRALFFDKTPQKNWFVSWHQDKTVTVSKRRSMHGWHTWSMKDGVQHVQPPLSVLEKMVTFRLHIDPAGTDDGCLWVIPGSHQYGLLDEATIAAMASRETPLPCVVNAGDAIIMRPHTLHSSRKATSPSHRRVVHLEYSSFVLPGGLRWA